MSNTTATPAPPTALPLTFGGFTIPAGCRRIFITAQLEPSNPGALIQPTGFPDLGPVLYPDPAQKVGLICLIESEAKMGNWLEEVCLGNKYEGTWRTELTGLPYVKLTKDGTTTGEFVTASTIDGHRFASEYVMSAHLPATSPEFATLSGGKVSPPANDPPDTASKTKATKGKASSAKPEFVLFLRNSLGMTSEDKCPAANVPRIHRLAMDYDPMALLHGFQISVKKKLTFVGLRSPRAITASIVGSGCERVTVPGVRFDPIGTASAAQAIFQKPRITAKKIEARFCIDVGLLSSLYVGATSDQATSRLQLLLKVGLCKIAWFLKELHSGMRLRTDCNLRLVSGATKYWFDRIDGDGTDFDFTAVTVAVAGGLGIATDNSLGFDAAHSPLVLQYVVSKAKEEKDTENAPEGETARGDGSGTEEES
jgi:CRISPR-associated protein Csb1